MASENLSRENCFCPTLGNCGLEKTSYLELPNVSTFQAKSTLSIRVQVLLHWKLIYIFKF